MVNKTYYHTLILTLILSGVSLVGYAATVDEVTDAGVKRATENAAAQQTVDKLAEQSGNLVADYKSELKLLEGLKLYNDLQQRQVDNQNTYINDLGESIGKVAVIERQIVPLMASMIESLENFVALDIPFHKEERSERVQNLRELLERPDVSVAEKFRKVLEAYEIEIEFGRTIDAHSGKLEAGGQAREVDFLRIGRVAYLYQTASGDETGMWNQETQQWETIPAEIYQRQVARGLRLARKEEAPDLLILPVPAAQKAGQ